MRFSPRDAHHEVISTRLCADNLIPRPAPSAGARVLIRIAHQDCNERLITQGELLIRSTHQDCSSGLLTGIAHQDCSTRLLVRIAPQDCSSGLLLSIAHQDCSSGSHRVPLAHVARVAAVRRGGARCVHVAPHQAGVLGPRGCGTGEGGGGTGG